MPAFYRPLSNDIANSALQTARQIYASQGLMGSMCFRLKELYMLRTLILASVISATAFSAASAQNVEVIKQRKELFEAMGKAAKDPGKMMKQEIPFDKATVEAALDTFIEKTPKLPDLFPDDSKEGGKTEALPAIWQNKKDFTDRFTKLVADAKAAKGMIGDEFALMEKWPTVVGNCGGCHKKYREKKK